MSDISINHSGESIEVDSPYHSDFPASAKALGGRWTGSAWRFDARDESRVRELIARTYGVDPDTLTVIDPVTVRVTVGSSRVSQTLWLAGREIATRRGRDIPVRLGHGVIITSGEFPRSGGSGRYPNLGASGITMEVRDVSRAAIEEYLKNPNPPDPVEIVPDPEPSDNTVSPALTKILELVPALSNEERDTLVKALTGEEQS